MKSKHGISVIILLLLVFLLGIPASASAEDRFLSFDPLMALDSGLDLQYEQTLTPWTAYTVELQIFPAESWEPVCYGLGGGYRHYLQTQRAPYGFWIGTGANAYFRGGSSMATLNITAGVKISAADMEDYVGFGFPLEIMVGAGLPLGDRNVYPIITSDQIIPMLKYSVVFAF